MRNLFLILIFAFTSTLVFGQKSDADLIKLANKAEKSDPRAMTIMEKVKKKYNSYKVMDGKFKLTIQNYDDKEIQKGRIIRSGNKYRLEMDAQNIISDGKTIWIHLIEPEEVQVNEVDEDGLTPGSFLNIYEKSNDFILGLNEEGLLNGKKVTQIYLKPKNKNESEFGTMIISIDKSTNAILSIKAFSNDGTNYTLDLISLKSAGSIDEKIFRFNKADHPNVRIFNLD